MKRELTYATVCSGIECCSVACIGLPMRPVFFSEIEPFPCAVLKAHYPDVPNLGDMSKIQVSDDGKEITNGTTTIRLHERLGILAGGTPCQDVSVAGKRAGMQEGSGTRSSLAFDFVRLARELRPRWVLWENVAGSIDSKNAPDFLRFASALGDCGYTLAWRILDAQYVMCADIHAPDGRVDVPLARAVPQRRRRVWLLGMRTVGRLGADEPVPAQILFEPDCVAGHTAPRRRTGEGFAYSLAGRDRVDAPVVGEPAADRDGGCLNPLDPQSKRLFTPDGVIHTIYGRADKTGNNTPGVCIALEGNGQRPSHKGTGINATGASFTLNHVEQHGVAYESQCYENHAQDSCIKPIAVSDTRNQKDGTGGNNLPLVVMAYRPPIQDLIAEACAKYGANWPEDDWAEITDEVVLNIYTDMDGRRRATAFQKSDTNLEFGVDISYVGDSATEKCKCFTKVSHPTAPNGEGERWDEREVAQTRNTFDNGEKRCQEVVVSMAQNTRDEVRIVGGDGQIAGALPAEPGMKQQAYVVSTQGLDGYNKTLTGDVSPTVTAKRSDLHHVPGVVSTNSNGEDVAPTISSCEYKMGQKQKDTGGGYVVSRRAKEGAEGE